MSYIVGLVNLPPQLESIRFTDGQGLSNCDFLILDATEIETLARLFFEDRIDELIRLLLRHRPVNRFSHA